VFFFALNAAFACNVGFKGFAILCGLVRMRRARRRGSSIREILLVAGTPLAFLAAPILWLYLLQQLALGHAPNVGIDGNVAALIATANLIVGNGIMVGCSALAAIRRRPWLLACCACLMPCYWVLHSVAAWRALGQLITKEAFAAVSTALPVAA
jgi:hypothetical protein